jgi:hypothetical protein
MKKFNPIIFFLIVLIKHVVSQINVNIANEIKEKINRSEMSMLELAKI